MPTLNTQVPISGWSPPLKVTVQHVNLTEILESVMRGIAQAARGELKEIDVSKLPTDDDD
jgi:hypothetical protein